MNYMGDFLEDATVYITFNTFDSNDPSASVTITDLAAGDVEIWKDGVIQTTSGAGVTLTLNIGTNNGTHLIAVDTSNTTDGGFYVISADYQVRINGTTIDGATVNAWVGSFSIENRFKEVNVTAMAAGVIANATFAADVGSTAHGDNIIALAVRKILEELNLDHLLKITTGVAADGELEPYVVAGTVLAHVMAAGADATAFKASTDSLEAIKVHADSIKSETVLIVEDTSELQADDYPTSIAAIKAETALIVADTSELQVDDYPTSIAAVKTVVDDLDTLTKAAGDGDLAAVKVIIDALTAAGAAKLALGATTMITGIVSWDNTNATTTVIYSSDIIEATADHFNGRLFVPTSGDLVGQYTEIEDYSLDTGEGKFTVTALTEPPANDTTFVIL